MIDLSGPMGGALAGAFGTGSVAGWALAMKVVGGRIAELKADIERERKECHDRVTALEERATRFEDFMLHGMERQLAQTRQSTVQILGTPGETVRMVRGDDG